MADEYSIEPLSTAHFAGLQALFAEAFGAAPDAGAMKKRYDTRSLGADTISYVAIHQPSGKIAAHFAASPVQVLVGQKPVLAAQSIDAATAGDHRGKGLFRRLADAVHEACRQKEVAIVFSQPNASSYHGFVNSFGFTHVDDINRWDMKLRVKTFPASKLLQRHRRTRALYFSAARLSIFPWKTERPASFNHPAPDGTGRVLRNKAYLQYKEVPGSFFVRLGRVTAWVRLTDVLWVGDFSDYSLVDEKALLSLRRLAFWMGLNTISFHLNDRIPQPAFLRYFKKYKTEPSCLLYLRQEYSGVNLVLTGVDFDTW
jgi:predicted N-acetyltransferase YhbS